MNSKCPFCGNANDTDLDRKNKFQAYQVLIPYIPGISRDIIDFKVVICRKCDREYQDKNITLFGMSPRYAWVVPVIVLGLLTLMIYYANTR